jgi:hypothetical protein
MKQHAFEFDTSVAEKGFQKIQAANEHPFSQGQHDACLGNFWLTGARPLASRSERQAWPRLLRNSSNWVISVLRIT